MERIHTTVNESIDKGTYTNITLKRHTKWLANAAMTPTINGVVNEWCHNQEDRAIDPKKVKMIGNFLIQFK